MASKNWASRAIEDLEAGRDTIIYPKGHSMSGKIESGQKVILSPVSEDLKKEDIVLVKVKGNIYLHLIHDIQYDKYLIGNNKNHMNGWVERKDIFGIVTEVGEKD